MDDTTKGALFIALMIPIAVRYFYKTGRNDTSLNWIDLAIAAGLVVVIVAMNI